MNTQNIIHLIKRYFIESGKKDINSSLLIVLVVAFVSFFSVSGSLSDSMMGFLLFIMGIVYAGRMFNIFQPTGRSIHYLTIPASTAEKTVANGLLVFIYYNAILILSLLIGNIIGGFAHKLLDPEYIFVFRMPFSLDNMISLLLLESVFMFGSIYFRNHTVIKTFLVIIGVFFFFIILDTVIVGRFFLILNSNNLKNIQGPFDNINTDFIEYTFSIIVFIFFNFLTWLRLRETEA